MYVKYCVGILVVLCLAKITTSQLADPQKANILTAKDAIGHFPGPQDLMNTIYPAAPAFLPPGYTYSRKVRTSGGIPQMTSFNMPAGYTYSRKIHTGGNPYQYTQTYPGGYTYRRTYRHNNADNFWPFMLMADNM